MKRKLLLSILMLVFVASVLVACNSEQAPEGIKVTFDLQGGEYRTSTSAVEVYYNYPDGAKRVIKPLGDLSKKEVTRSKYDLVGWYKSISEDGTFDQADLWDFARDEIAADGSEFYVHFDFQGEEMIAKMPAKNKIDEQTKLALRFTAEDMFVFDPVSGERICL